MYVCMYVCVYICGLIVGYGKMFCVQRPKEYGEITTATLIFFAQGSPYEMLFNLVHTTLNPFLNSVITVQSAGSEKPST